MRVLSSWYATRGRLISLLAGGNAAGQLITLSASPVLARLYSPASFGEFAVVVSLASVAAVTATLSLQQAINVPPDRAAAAGIARLSLQLAGIATILGFLAAAAWLGWGGGAGYWWLAPVLVGGNATAAVLAIWANREGRFSLLVRTRLAGAIAGTGGMLVLARSGTAGLLAGQALGAVVSAAWLAQDFYRTAPNRHEGPARAELWRRHRYFPLWRLPADLLNTVVAQVPLWIFGQAFGAAVAGYFSFAHRVYNAPVTLIGNAIGEVFTRQAGESYRRRRECREPFDHFTRDLLLAGVALCLPVAAFGPQLFAFVFGPQWRGAGDLARWLSVWYFLRFVVSPVTMMLVIAARPGIDLALQLTLLAGVGLAWLVADATGSLPTTIAVLTGAGAIFYGANFAIARGLARGGIPAGALR
jgi:O-antigen/teichoic acid export membrane protein